MTDYLKLKKSNCKNCYKCIRNCPVKSIRFSGNQAHIVGDECILCGQCFVVCPQNAKEIRNDIDLARVLISENKNVVASVAPSFVANYPGVSIKSMQAVLKKLGFSDVQETAVGATIVKKQYEKMINEARQDVIISSCCHTVNLLIQKHFPEALPYLAPVMSPMQAHSRQIKLENPEAKTVFIGPCISKKAEAETYSGLVDCVLTYEELTQWLAREHISFESAPDENDLSRARLFPTAGGILKTMDCVSDTYGYLSVDGLENCINAIKDVINGDLSKCFIEMSACKGSCIGGPAMEKSHRSPVRDYLAVEHYAGRRDFVVEQPVLEKIKKEHVYIGLQRKLPSETEMLDILQKMGKTKVEDELNCGTCGYNTCREKAIAVFSGKADLTMCLPFLKEKAESFSDTIIKNTPNGIIVLNEALEVQQINAAARRIMNIQSASDVLGEQVIRILEPTVFFDVMQKGRSIHNKRVYLAEYKRYVEQTVIYDRSYHIIMCIMRDVTTEESDREKKEKISHQTIEIADKVVEKQMRVVQEIASLLGETTAETKIALTRLKESLRDE
ncbi:MAG: 4Fe-4S binding protein [Anaerolineae bacterium]|nr:4Fe-4S binding protein [Anaerolineae bacterium]